MVFAHIFFEKGKFPEKLSRGSKLFCAKFFGVPFSERKVRQMSAFPVVLGKSSTSRMLETPVIYMMSLSNPSPKPA